MYSIAFRCLIVCLSVTIAFSQRNTTICREEIESCGLIPPTLPVNFELKGEFVNYVNKTLTWQEIYFDNLNLIGKYVIYHQNTKITYIFDYSIGQVIEYAQIHPGRLFKKDPLSDTCLAKPIQSSPMKYIFGYKMPSRETKQTHMFNSYEVLHFGGEYKFRSNGTEGLDDRGLQSNEFIGCVYDDSWNATMATTYYFSTNKDLTPTTPLDTPDFESVPIQANFYGESSQNGQSYAINTQESISWFKSNPEFKYDTFKIPQGLFCDSYHGDKPFPDLPTAFSTRLERTGYTQDADGQLKGQVYRYQEIWYNVETGLARIDFTPQNEDEELYKKFGNKNPVKAIYDFNIGIVYIVNKLSGRCFARPITQTDFFQTSKEKEFIAMASPEEIFLMDRDTIEYKGKDFVRDIKTDVWMGKYRDEQMNVTRYLETYITTDGWNEDADEQLQYKVPIRHTAITNTMENNEFLQTIDEMNFFKFKKTAPPLVVFDIYRDSCIDTIERAWMGIKLEVTSEFLDVIQKYKFYVTEALQTYIADITGVGTPLRVQRVNVRKVQDGNMITFSLLGRTKLESQTPRGEMGVDLKMAIDNLAVYIDAGNFTVIFTDALGMTQEIKANPGSLGRFKIASAPARMQDVQLGDLQYINSRPKRHANFIFFADEPRPTKKTIIRGMSAGGLAGLSITMLIIGIGVGVGLMYFYIKRYGDQGSQEYQMK